MNFYDVLAAEKWGGGIPTTNFFDLLFAQSMGGGGQWQTYEGTLPATLNANGDDMRQYQIYGNTGGVGDRTVQLFDKNATNTKNGYIVRAYLNRDGTVVSESAISEYINVSEYMPVSGNTNYILRYGMVTGYYNVPSMCFYDISKDFISGLSYSNKNPKSFTTPASAAYVRLSFARADVNVVALAKGSTIPEPLPPFGYEVDMVSRTRNLFSSIWEQGSISATNGQNEESSERVRTEGYIEVIPNKIYSFSRSIYNAFMNVRFYSSSKSFIGIGSTSTIRLIVGGNESNPMPAGYSFCCFEIIDANIKYMRIDDQSNNLATKYMMVEGRYTQNTMPDYEPYSNTTTPIYIGNDPLDKDEYADYQEGKVFRYGNNIFDLSAKSGANGYVNDRYLTNTGLLQTSSLWYVSEYMDVEFKKYKVVSGIQSGAVIAEYDENKNFLTAHTYTSGIKITFEVLSNCKYLRMSVYKNAENSTSLNALQPTDPPVPLPALPTCEGETVIDYAGESVAPEKVVLKYKKGGN
jgi:hypothetical protein